MSPSSVYRRPSIPSKSLEFQLFSESPKLRRFQSFFPLLFLFVFRCRPNQPKPIFSSLEPKTLSLIDIPPSPPFTFPLPPPLFFYGRVTESLVWTPTVPNLATCFVASDQIWETLLRCHRGGSLPFFARNYFQVWTLLIAPSAHLAEGAEGAVCLYCFPTRRGETEQSMKNSFFATRYQRISLCLWIPLHWLFAYYPSVRS